MCVPWLSPDLKALTPLLPLLVHCLALLTALLVLPADRVGSTSSGTSAFAVGPPADAAVFVGLSAPRHLRDDPLLSEDLLLPLISTEALLLGPPAPCLVLLWMLPAAARARWIRQGSDSFDFLSQLKLLRLFASLPGPVRSIPAGICSNACQVCSKAASTRMLVKAAAIEVGWSDEGSRRSAVEGGSSQGDAAHIDNHVRAHGLFETTG